MAKLYERLIERAERDTLRGHMPGHKGVPLLGVPAERIDFTELSDTGNLYDLDENIIREAERDAALAAGAEWCVYSAGGSTLLIQGMLGVAARRAAAKGRNLRVLAARDAHRSLFSATALLGGDAEFIYPQYNEIWNISEGIRAEDVRAALADGDYDAVYVTSPSYYGMMSDLAGISEACADAGVLLLVDAAHGGHLVFCASERSRSCGGAAAAASGAGLAGARSDGTERCLWQMQRECRRGQRSENLLGAAEQNSQGTATGAGCDGRASEADGTAAAGGALCVGCSGAGDPAPPPNAERSACAAAQDAEAVCNGGAPYDAAALYDSRHAAAPCEPLACTCGAAPFGIHPECIYIMCCSAHKTLGALGGGAFALGNADKTAMISSMQLFGSSSPSYVILASLDRAIEAAASDAGRAALAACVERVARLRERVAAIDGVSVLRCTRASEAEGPAPQPIAEQSARAVACGVGASSDHGASCVTELLSDNAAATAPCVPTARTCGAPRLDPCRFVFAIDGADGRDVAEWLERERGVVAEMADARNVVFIMTAQDGEEDFARLWAAVRDCAAVVRAARDIFSTRLRLNANGFGSVPACRFADIERRPRDGDTRHIDIARLTLCRGRWHTRGRRVEKTPHAPPRGERVCSLRDALLAPCETVRLADAGGRVAAEAIAPYPPGVPIIAPGEKISQKTIAFFKDIGYNVNKGVRVLASQTSKREDIQ